MRKATHDFAALDFFRRRAALGMLNERRKILVLPYAARNMLAARIACRTRGVQSILITRRRRHNAVGGHQNRTVKRREFLFLLPPRVAVISDKVRIFLKRRIVMRGQHFRVRVYIHARAFRLLQQHLQIA